MKLADKISQPQVQVLSMDISRKVFLKFRTHEVENALNIATLVLRPLVPVVIKSNIRYIKWGLNHWSMTEFRK